MPVPLFQYFPLDPEIENSFRLLKLHAGVGNAPLTCELWHQALTKSCEFDALSYVWGSPEELDPANVYLSNPPHEYSIATSELQRLPILSNLRGALRHLRLPNEDRFVWVDALCINQLDHAKKSQQVPIMGKIYQSAQSVFIWLGEEADDSDLAL